MQWEEIKVLLFLWAAPFLSGDIRDVFGPGLLKVCLSFAPLGHAKVKFFRISSLCHVVLATGFVFECFTCSIRIFSYSLFIFTVQQRPDHAQAPAVLLMCGIRFQACVMPHSFTVEYKVTGRNRRKKTGWDQAFPFLQSFLSVPVYFSPFRNFQCRFENSCGVFLKIFYWIRENYLFWKAVSVNYFSLPLLYVEFSSDSKLVYMSSINLLNSGFLSMAFPCFFFLT